MEFDLLLGIVLCCLLKSFGTFGFNVDIEKAVVFDGPVDRTSQSKYFGYSVALHSYGSDYWVLVGAPLSNVSCQYNPTETLVRYGAVYKCNFATEKCTFIDIDNTPASNSEEKSGMWLGGTVYSTGKDGKALACAPRYVLRLQRNLPLGSCRILTEALTTVAQNGKLHPCGNEDHSSWDDYAYCQAGMDATYTADGKHMIMGAVGAKQSKGVIFAQADDSKPKDKSVVDQLDIFGYMGYSVSSGHFTDLKRTEFVGGAPRADGVRGKVIIYYNDTNNKLLLVKAALPRPKNLPIGTYFGSAICAVDLDNDKFSDILVGAPYFTSVKDEGRVYIYLNNGQGALNLQLDSFLQGDNQVNAHFGHTIASVGDLNADGYNDVAIGAPMEEGSGAVYIYHGSSKGIELKYRQKILGSKVKLELKMFGISVSGGVDVDENGYPDIAVGAYGSENAVIMRTQSIVNVEGKITPSKQQMTLEGNDSLCDLEGVKLKCLEITLAFSYDDVMAATNTKDLKINYIVDLDKDKGQDAFRRMFFWDAVNKQRTFTLKNSTTIPTRKTLRTLQPQTVYILDKDEIGDVTSLLSFDLTISLPPPPCADLCPVLNGYLPSTFRAEIPFRKMCKNEVACVPDLAVTIGLVSSPDYGNDHELRIGVVKNFTVQLAVENKAVDHAYTTKIKLKYPENLDFIGPDKGIVCDDRSTPDNGTITVTCDVANPLQGNTKKEFGIKFKPGTVRENFVIEVEALSQDTDAQDKDNTARLSVSVSVQSVSVNVSVNFEADVEITGTTDEEQVSYGGKVVGESAMKTVEDIGNRVIHKYFVKNRGPDVIPLSEVVIQWPFEATSGKPLLYLIDVQFDGKRVKCDFKPDQLNLLGLQFPQTPGACSGQQQNDTSVDEAVKTRRRREVDDTEESSTKVKREAEAVKDKPQTELDCELGTATCTNIRCTIKSLKPDDNVTITVVSRLWIATMIEDYQGQLLRVISRATVWSLNTFVLEANKDNNKAKVGTTLTPYATVAAPPKKLRNWYIPVCVVVAVHLLVLIVLCLCKLGFSKHMNMTNPEERENILGNGKSIVNKLQWV